MYTDRLTYISQFAVLCVGLFLLLGTQIVPTKIALSISDHTSFRRQFLMKSKATPLESALAYSSNIVPMTAYQVEDNLFSCIFGGAKRSATSITIGWLGV